MWAFFRPLPLFPQKEVQGLLKGGRIHVVVPYPWGDETVSSNYVLHRTQRTLQRQVRLPHGCTNTVRLRAAPLVEVG